MILTVEIPDNVKDVNVSVLCDGKPLHYDSSRYKPGYWNGINGGTHYCQYFDMDDENRVREMTEVASALANNLIRYDLSKMKRFYRIAISKKDYINMNAALRNQILEINCFHDRL